MKILLILLMLVGVANAEMEMTVCDNFRCYPSIPQHMTAECTPERCPEFYWRDNTVTVPPWQELIDAAEGVLPYLDAPTDSRYEFRANLPVLYLPTEIDIAEREVERLKKKDAAIRRFRDALRKARGEK